MFMLGSVKDGKPYGCIVNTVTQVSQEPPMLSVSVSRGNYTNGVVRASGLASVNILSQSASMDMIRTFGFTSGKDTDKFAKYSYIPTADDLPVLEDGICGWFECRVKDAVELPTATVFILEVFESERMGDRFTPMTYAYYQMVEKGRVSKNAPGHTLPEDEGGRAPEPKYV
jgi:flavin reductase (DIM6/NTAB) family NADH-FMN oxidoreductase RutF